MIYALIFLSLLVAYGYALNYAALKLTRLTVRVIHRGGRGWTR